jgi:hypothetical protein
MATHPGRPGGIGDPVLLKSLNGRIETSLIENFHAEVIETLRSLWVFEKHELQGRLIECKVGVARSLLVRLGTEQAAVIGHRFIEIADIQGELQAHGVSPIY